MTFKGFLPILVTMIRLLKEGKYKLIETRKQTKILSLDKEVFAWISTTKVGEILVVSHKSYKTDHMLSIGKYRMYEVEDESKLTDLIHLELLVGEGKWQGYLLPTGLPNKKKIRSKMIPTREIITKVIFNYPLITPLPVFVNY